VESSQCDIITLTQIIRATAGAAVNDLCVNCIALVIYLNILQKDIKMGTFVLDELPHLIAVFSIGLIIDLLGNGDDVLARGIGSTTITHARLIPGSLRAKRSGSRAAWRIKDAYPSGVCGLLSVDCIGCWYRNGEDGEDEGEKGEKNQGEFVHCQAGVVQNRNGPKRCLRENVEWSTG
jgi:hypothetical protein